MIKVTSVKNYLNQINGFGLTNLISLPTGVNNLGGTLVDHFYCSSSEKVINSYVLLSDISDHFQGVGVKHFFLILFFT